MTLNSPVEDIPQIGPKSKKQLENLDIHKVGDLLYHFPVSYDDTSKINTISEAKEKGEGTVIAEVIEVKSVYLRNRKILVKAKVQDESDTANITWYNQKYITNVINEGEKYYFKIKLPDKSGARDFYCKEYEKFSEDNDSKTLGKIAPVYSLTSGISKKWLTKRVLWVLDKLDQLNLPSPPQEVIEKEDLVGLHQAISTIHNPSNHNELQKAKDRLAFDELYLYSLKLEETLKNQTKNKSHTLKVDGSYMKEFFDTLPFELTSDQQKALESIVSDMATNEQMNTLLNGDVGSGKTIVAVIAALISSMNGYQTILMAPTIILATQHYETFKDYLTKFDIPVHLRVSGIEAQEYEDNAIIIGTHAILHTENIGEKAGLAIIDEQHRFGVNQREQIRKLGGEEKPHFLMMTATPIPRTLATVLYGDMNVIQIKEMPSGRKPVATKIVPQSKRNDCLDWIESEIIESDKIQQAFVVLPLIEENEDTQLRSTNEVYKELKSYFDKVEVGMLHGKLSDDEKTQIIKDFENKKVSILVSTTVIEVGINVPDACYMVIEHAERFGLAQLHQLRGRVGRSDLQAYCFLLETEKGDFTADINERLDYFAKHNSGFDVAEYDLSSRGPGEVYGLRQAGIIDFRFADIMDIEEVSRIRKLIRQHH